eukprot:6485470-Amphidinium_carterae.2
MGGLEDQSIEAAVETGRAHRKRVFDEETVETTCTTCTKLPEVNASWLMNCERVKTSYSVAICAVSCDRRLLKSIGVQHTLHHTLSLASAEVQSCFSHTLHKRSGSGQKYRRLHPLTLD